MGRRRLKNDRYRLSTCRSSSVETSPPVSHCFSRSARAVENSSASRFTMFATKLSACSTASLGSSTKDPCTWSHRDRNPCSSSSPNKGPSLISSFFCTTAGPWDEMARSSVSCVTGAALWDAIGRSSITADRYSLPLLRDWLYPPLSVPGRYEARSWGTPIVSVLGRSSNSSNSDRK